MSKEADKYLPDIKIRTPVVIAELLNNAGIVGAAVLVHSAGRGGGGAGLLPGARAASWSSALTDLRTTSTQPMTAQAEKMHHCTA